MKLARIYIALLFCYWGETVAFAQTIPIPDPAFRSYLDSFYTALLDPSTKALKIQEAGNLTDSFYISKRGVKTLEGIQYFKNITALYCQQNKLTSLPDLSNLIKLTQLDCYENQLTKLPPLNKLVQLNFLNAFDNKLVELPAIDSLKNLKELVVFRNQLKTIPDLSMLSQLQRLDCYENRLTSIGKVPASLKQFSFGRNLMAEFPDVSLAKNLESVGGYNNQLGTIPDLAAYKSLSNLNLGTNKIQSVPASLSTMIWLTTLTLDNNLMHEIPDLSALTQLAYCKIENNFLTFDDLNKTSANPHFKDWIINPQDSLSISKAFNPAERQAIRIALSEADTSSGLIYTWYHNGVLKTTTNKPFLDFSSVQKADNGTYYCRVSSVNAALSSLILYSNAFEIQVLPDFVADENLSLTPNGDGKNDEMYFSEQGPLLVYDSQGKLLDQLQAPCYWNGSTKSGKELSTGIYLIEINKNVIYRVTIIR